jgi:2-polyprenyl-3-methyl-5-hydroxy-6-metoxy-1,4-benzoquinol methylase
MVYIAKKIIEGTPFWLVHIGDYIRNLYFLQYLKILPLWKFKTVLDAGCGDGTYAINMALQYPHINITGIDIDIKETSVKTPANLLFIRENLLQMQTKEAYDFIYSIDVIEHIPDNVRVLNIFFNALKPNGYMYLHTPSRNGGRHIFPKSFFNTFHTWELEEHIGDMYTFDELTTVLKNIGFKIVKVQYTFGLLGQFAWELDRISDGKILLKILMMPFLKIIAHLSVKLSTHFGDLLILVKKPQVEEL